MSTRRFRATRAGVAVTLGDAEQQVLGSVVEQFRQLLFSGSDPNLTRLEPPACTEDPDIELEYREMASTSLLSHRLDAIDVVQSTLGARASLGADEVAAWMQTLNCVRLYLGERLGVADGGDAPTEDDPDAGLMPVFEWLGGMLEELVQAAEPGLPPGSDD